MLIIAIETMSAKFSKIPGADTRLYVEYSDQLYKASSGQDLYFPGGVAYSGFMLFIKYYDPLSGQLK